MPLEVARTLPIELLRLMGYQRGAYALGYVGDLLDPIQVVRPDIGNIGLGYAADTLEKLKRQQSALAERK